MKSDKSYILCIEQKKLLKMYTNRTKGNTKMDTIFMDFKKSKTSDLHRLLLNLTDEINLKRSDKYVALSNLSICYTWENVKKSLKYQLQHRISDILNIY